MKDFIEVPILKSVNVSWPLGSVEATANGFVIRAIWFKKLLPFESIQSVHVERPFFFRSFRRLVLTCKVNGQIERFRLSAGTRTATLLESLLAAHSHIKLGRSE